MGQHYEGRRPRPEPRKRPVEDRRLPEQDTDGNDVCWGRHPVFALLEETPERVLKVFVQSGSRLVLDVAERCRERRIPFQEVAREHLDRLCPDGSHQGIVARVSEAPLLELTDVLEGVEPGGRLLVVLDHVQDPHNLGAIARSAEAAGALAIVVPKRRAALPSGTVVKTSAGASLRLPFAGVVNIARAIEELKEAGFWVIGLAAEAPRTLWEKPYLDGDLAIVVGAEGEGLSRVAAEACDDVRSIPMAGSTGSLNASVAASVALFEWVRRQAEKNQQTR